MLSRLGLVLAIATLYLSVTGTEVVARGDRRWVEPHWFRGSSYLKIGWSWVRQALVWGWQITDSLKLSYHPDPVPAIASCKQNRNRNKPLKFQTTTIDASHSQLRPTQTRESKAA